MVAGRLGLFYPVYVACVKFGPVREGPDTDLSRDRGIYLRMAQAIANKCAVVGWTTATSGKAELQVTRT